MSANQEVRCPECDGVLGDGFIGYFSGIVWSENDPAGLRRLIPFVFGATRFVVGSLTSTPWVRSRTARKWRDCGALVIPATGD